MRYLAQALPSREWITHDLMLSGVTITRDLSGPSALTATIARGFAMRRATVQKPDGSLIDNRDGTVTIVAGNGVTLTDNGDGSATVEVAA